MNEENHQITDSEWDEFIATSDYSGFMQSSAWAKVKEAEGWKIFRIAIVEKGKIKAASLLLCTNIDEKHTMLYSPQGPVFRWHLKKDKEKYLPKLVKMVENIASQVSAVCWRIEPWAVHFYGDILEKNFQKSPVDMQPRHTALIPILKSEEEILANFKPKTRYNIRLAQKHGLTVEIGSKIEDFHTFYDVYRKTVDRKSLDFKEFPYFESIAKNLGANSCAFAINIKKDGLPIESVVLIKFGKKLTYFFGGFDYEYRKYMAPYLCHFEAIRLGKKLGCDFYDLWGIANTDDLGHPWHSFTEFKNKFNPIKISLTGAYDIIFDQDGYKRYFQSEIS